jgi:hypothetical protein
MTKGVPLICPIAKAEYFLFQGLTRFLKIRSDLPVGLFCRSAVIASEAKQSIAPRTR